MFTGAGCRLSHSDLPSDGSAGGISTLAGSEGAESVTYDVI